MKDLLRRVLPQATLANMKQVLLPAFYARGYAHARSWKERSSAAGHSATQPSNSETSPNPLWNYFANHKEGRGIWKWEHYFDVYHRHFSRFVGTPAKVLEIGIYSGGSLDMWRSYFGSESHIYGVDIQSACKAYENEHTTIFIGDQEDPAFWAQFNEKVQGIDILIDDGGHTPKQQMVTLEQMLPRLRPGGVYVCEDVHGIHHGFAAFVGGLVTELNRVSRGSGHDWMPTPFQSACHSIHLYPYLVVIEKHLDPPSRFSAPRHGTQWQPFYGSDGTS